MHALSKLLYCLPFELNQHVPLLQLQLTEHFEISYFSHPDHLWHRRHTDSGFTKVSDTGIKITALFAITSPDSKPAAIRIWNN